MGTGALMKDHEGHYYHFDKTTLAKKCNNHGTLNVINSKWEQWACYGNISYVNKTQGYEKWRHSKTRFI